MRKGVPYHNRMSISSWQGYSHVEANSLLLDAIVIMAPALVFVEFRLVGRLFLTELILMGLLPFLLLRSGRLLFAPVPRTLILLGFFWLAGQVATDLFRNTPFSDYSRGWSKIAYTMINFMAIYLLLQGNRRRLILFAVGLVIGGMLLFLVRPNEYALEDPWKFGYAVPLTLGLVLVAQTKIVYRTRVLPAVILIFASYLNLVNDFRSLAGICFVVAAYLILQQWAGRRAEHGIKYSAARTIFIAFAGVFFAFLAFVSYDYAASENLLGWEASQKYLTQSQGSFGVLLGGRAEIYASFQAITDSPILGHGSWAKNPLYRNMLFELGRYGYDVNLATIDRSDLIPTHSHLFGAWVEAGLLGAIFWLWSLRLCGRVLGRLYLLREPLSPLIVFVAVVLFWDIFFSPYGGERRVSVPYYLVLMIAAWDMLQGWRMTANERRGQRT